MNQKSGISKSTTIISGSMFLVMGVIAIFVGMNLLGSILLVLIGLVGIVGGIFGTFEDNKET